MQKKYKKVENGNGLSFIEAARLSMFLVSSKYFNFSCVFK